MWIFAAITKRLDAILKLMHQMQSDLARIEKTLQRWSLPRPEALTVTLLREEGSMLVYQANFPTLPDPVGDIQRKKFTATVNGAALVDSEYDLSVTKSDEFSVEDNAEVTLSIAYVDDAGNLGPVQTQTFTALDTISPSAPGPFGEIELLREE